jgi:hypothetical protein
MNSSPYARWVLGLNGWDVNLAHFESLAYFSPALRSALINRTLSSSLYGSFFANFSTQNLLKLPNYEKSEIRYSPTYKSGMSGLLSSPIQIIYRIEIGQGDDKMGNKTKLKKPVQSPNELRSQHNRQTSKEELEEVRKRGRYVVLPPVEGPQEESDWEDWPALIL